MMRPIKQCVIIVAAVIGAFSLTQEVAADELETPQVAESPSATARDAAQVTRDGTFLPTTLSARIGDQRVMGLSLGGYDTAPGQGAIMSTVVEGAIFNRVAIRAGIEYDAALTAVTPSAGVRVALLRQEHHRVDLALAALYKNQGFSEANGEVELIVMLARRWNRLGTFANVAYGQGLTPDERDAEIRMALLYAIRDRFNVGFDARARFDLGADSPARQMKQLENDFDLIAGPLATYAVSHLMLMAQAGAHALLYQETAHAGFVALGGVGTSF